MPPESKRAVMLSSDGDPSPAENEWERVMLDLPSIANGSGRPPFGWHARVESSRVVVSGEPAPYLAPTLPPEHAFAAHGDLLLDDTFGLTRAGRPVKLEYLKGSIATGCHAEFSGSGKYLVAAFWTQPSKLDPFHDTTPCHVRVWDTESGELVTWFQLRRLRFEEANRELLVLNDRTIFYVDWDAGYNDCLSVVDVTLGKETDRVRFEQPVRIFGGHSGFIVQDDMTKPLVMQRMRAPATEPTE